MVQGWVIVLVGLAYIGLLFAIARYGDKRADAGRSIIRNPYVYALSLGVYCTAWTFYGSVGRAASSGIGFLPIYLGPTLMIALWWYVLLKIIRISKTNRITSIADFIAARYGKSSLLGGLVVVLLLVGIIPYISLQLKAVSTSFMLLWRYPVHPSAQADVPILGDTALYVTLLMAVFAILFGTRHLDVTEHHEGLVAAIAFESVIKLFAFLAVGVFVTYGLYNGFADVFAQAQAVPDLRQLFVMDQTPGAYLNWLGLIVVSMLAIIMLPRQFQMAVIENTNEQHVRTAIWLFPLYMLLINIFVLPITFGGLLQFPGSSVDPDTFVLTLPLAEGQRALALVVFVGGLSAATSMVIVASVALSTMVSNNLVMPVLLKVQRLRMAERRDVSGLLLLIRRVTIVLLLLLGYAYVRVAGEAYALVSIGLVSFTAVAQCAPAMLGGIYWKEGNRIGALLGLGGGFAVWVYTLLLPSFAQSGWLPVSFIDSGPFGIAWLRPYQLFGVQDLDPVAHALFWSMLVNIGGYVGGSLMTQQSAIEHRQATLFVDVYKQTVERDGMATWRGTASVPELRALLGRFLGKARADEALATYSRQHGREWTDDQAADGELVQFAETLLAGSIGAASARAIVGSVVKEEPLSVEEVMTLLSETSQVIAYSRRLEQKGRELERATAELRAANQRLQELDRLKDDFVSTVTHELRTPLTSIRAFCEILYDNPDLEPERRSKFLGIIVKESERLTRLINQVLDLSKIESGKVEWNLSTIDVIDLIEEALASTAPLFEERRIHVHVDLPEHMPVVVADRDRILQVLLNLLSNAAKFCDPVDGRVAVRSQIKGRFIQVDIEDNGRGIKQEDLPAVFEKFRQVGDTLTEKPQGTGLGLPISRHIVEHFGGVLWADSRPGQGATFLFTLPYQPSAQPRDTTPAAEVAEV